MTTTTLTLTNFILARIADDEAVARAAGNVKAYRGSFGTGAWVEFSDGSAHAFTEAQLGAMPVPQLRALDHACRHDPARVLAECEAKRAIVEAAWADHVRIEGEWGMCRSREQMEAQGDVPDVVAHLATIYASHPDYREEWT